MMDRLRAPDFEDGLGWLNTDRPLQICDELRGQVVVLDFWTYCCINCMHILPELAFLEHKYANDPVTFIGVHSAKFANEASRETIRAAILRYEIRHSVVIDDDMKIWRSYAVRSWPTVVVIDTEGYVVAAAAGEGNREVIDETIARALAQGRADGTAATGPLTLHPEQGVRATSGLAFPGKVLASARENRLYVADSNHNRIVVAELPDESGRSKVIKVVGSGRTGADDGPATSASFNHPQGLAVGHGKLYVADTENHLIRAIDLSSFEVSTLLGTGEMSNDRAGGMRGTQQGLNSPWDLTLEGSTMYVAMAGIHQIWRIDLPVALARAFAGSGRENIVDGPTETAALAQPSGICIAGGNLYFADSEVSAIRGVNMSSEQVFTIIGEGLFSFGDVDGVQPTAKLQHPLGIDAWKESLLVADTYNHKIKLVEPNARSVSTLFGTGRPGASTPEGDSAFFEPGGLSVAGGEVYVADTNNHRVVRVNLETGSWSEIVFEGLTVPTSKEETTGDVIHVDPIAVAPGKDVALSLDIKLPAGAHLSPEAPWSVRVTCGDTTLVQKTGRSDTLPLQVTIPAESVQTGAPWRIAAALACCTDGAGATCVPLRITWEVRVSHSGDASRIAVNAHA